MNNLDLKDKIINNGAKASVASNGARKVTKNLSTSLKASKTLKGKVVSDKMDKTVVVAVENFVKHPKYGKFMVRTKKYKAHDPENKSKTGAIVFIKEVRPISKDKCYEVIYK